MKAFGFYMKCRYCNHATELKNDLTLSQWSVFVLCLWAGWEQKQILASGSITAWWGHRWVASPKSDKNGLWKNQGLVRFHCSQKHRVEMWCLPKQLWWQFNQLWICSEFALDKEEQTSLTPIGLVWEGQGMRLVRLLPRLTLETVANPVFEREAQALGS